MKLSIHIQLQSVSAITTTILLQLYESLGISEGRDHGRSKKVLK